MSKGPSRRRIARYFAGEITDGAPDVATRTAALLVDLGREKELPLLTRDIEAILETRGTLVADVTSANELPSSVLDGLRRSLAPDKGTVHLRTHVDESVIAGLRIGLPDREHDGTLGATLRNLRSKKV